MSCASDLAESFVAAHPEEAARILEPLSLLELETFIHKLKPATIAALFSQLVGTSTSFCLTKLKPEVRQEVISLLPRDTTAILLRLLNKEDRDQLLQDLPPTTGDPLRLLLTYPSRTAGALMDPGIVAWPQSMTVSECLLQIQQAAEHTVSYLYVIDEHKKLRGVLGYEELMGVDPKAQLKTLMKETVAVLNADASLESIVVHPGWRRYHALPVIDDAGRFLGVLRYKTFRSLEPQLSAEVRSPLHVVLSLSELCWIGMTAVWDSLVTVAKAREP